jgi:uncharacterized protein
MRVDIKTISRITGASLEIKATGRPEEIALSFQGYEFSQPVEFDGVVSNTGNEGFVVKGIVSTVWTSRCARCLEEVISRIEADVNVAFKSLHHRDASAQDNTDPEEEYTYQGYSIELDQALRDILILALPYRVLCSENCMGICRWCGTNLNDKDCKCDAAHKDEVSLLED